MVELEYIAHPVAAQEDEEEKIDDVPVEGDVDGDDDLDIEDGDDDVGGDQKTDEV